MSLTRHSLSDDQYARIEALLPATAKNNRLFMENHLKNFRDLKK